MLSAAKHLKHCRRDPSVAKPALSLSKGTLPQGDMIEEFPKALRWLTCMKHSRRMNSIQMVVFASY